MKCFTFSLQKDEIVVVGEEVEGQLLHMHYDVLRRTDEYKPRWDENGKMMTCKSIIDERDETHPHGFDIKETSIKLNVTRKCFLLMAIT